MPASYGRRNEHIIVMIAVGALTARHLIGGSVLVLVGVVLMLVNARSQGFRRLSQRAFSFYLPPQGATAFARLYHLAMYAFALVVVVFGIAILAGA
jgi:hypothetical protein